MRARDGTILTSEDHSLAQLGLLTSEETRRKPKSFEGLEGYQIAFLLCTTLQSRSETTLSLFSLSSIVLMPVPHKHRVTAVWQELSRWLFSEVEVNL